MGKQSTRENKTIYQIYREEAGLTRSEASEKMTAVSDSKIEKFEYEMQEPTPYDIIQMADAYKRPDLCNYYCSHKCEIGYRYVPEVKVSDLSNIILETIASLNEITPLTTRLIQIARDGKISDDEIKDFAFISKKLDEISLAIDSLNLWVDKTASEQVEKLRRNNYVVNRIKPDNEQIYYIIDTINEAINSGKQISFQYYDYTGLKKKVLKNKGEVYKLSPYKLLWCGDYYYVLGYSEKQRKVINFRVDRIVLRPDILAKDIIPMPDDFDIENYTKEVFFMFSGEKVLVDLRCDNSLMKTMVDRFGEDVTTLAYDMTSFRVQTEVAASPTFFGWVFGFNGKVQILAPKSVKEQYRQMIAKADEDMQESE